MYEIPSLFRLIPGDEDEVRQREPAAAAPMIMLIAAISLSAWRQSPPTLGIRLAIYSEISVWGVIG